MRKLVSLILAVVMICSMAVTAFAADNNATLTQNTPTSSYEADAKTGAVNTELWLQVDAEGQIDVTVPLVLVFKTDIDGGNATSPNTYGITNNSTSDLVVTEIKTVAENKTAAQPMTLVAYTATPTEDQYKVQLSVANDVVKGEGSSGAYDLHTASHTNDAIKGGLFELVKPEANATEGKFTQITADMATGKLSFVTSRTNNDELDTTKGVKLLTVTYTVAVDTSDAIGTNITTANENLPGTTNP